MCAPLLCGRASFCAPPMILSKFVLWACCRRHTTIETDSTCTLFSIHTYRFSNKTINKECNQKLDTWHGHVTQSHGKEVVTEARTVYGGLQKKKLMHCTRPHTSRWYNSTALQLDWLVLHFHENNTHENRGKHETKLRWFSSPRHVLKVERGLYANFGVQGGFTAIQGGFFFFSVCSGCRLYGGRGLIREKIQQSNFVRHPQLAGRNSTTERPHLLKHGIRNSSLKTTWELGGVKQQI